MDGYVLRVKTEQLLTTADEASRQIDRMEKAFTDAQNVIEKSRNYWEGSGQDSHVSHYRKRIENIQVALKRFRENVTDLQQMAGVYVEAEKNTTSIAQQLQTDIIS